MSLLECSLQSLKSLDSEEVKAMVHGSKLFAEALREGKFEHAFFALQMGASFQQDDLSSIFAGGQGLLAQQIFREVLLRGANLALSLFRILGNVPIDMDMLALCLDFIKKTPGGTDSLNQLNNRGEGVLHIAVYQKSVAALQLLVRSGARLDLKNKSGLTARELILSLNSREDLLAALQEPERDGVLVDGVVLEHSPPRKSAAADPVIIHGVWDYFRNNLFAKRCHTFVLKEGMQPAACVVCALPNQNGFYFGLLVGLNGQVQTIQLSKERIALYSWLFDEVESIRRAICCDSPQTLHKGWQVQKHAASLWLEAETRLCLPMKICVGLVFGSAQQTSEASMMANSAARCENCPFFSRFLSVLGVTWNGENEWMGWTGGVTAEERPVLASWRGFEFVFHVAYRMTPDQQRSRIGNNMVNVFFVDDPDHKAALKAEFRGQVNSVGLVVQADHLGSVFYRESLRGDFRPIWHGELRDVLFCNIVNGHYFASQRAHEKNSAVRAKMILEETLASEESHSGSSSPTSTVGTTTASPATAPPSTKMKMGARATAFLSRTSLRSASSTGLSSLQEAKVADLKAGTLTVKRGGTSKSLYVCLRSAGLFFFESPVDEEPVSELRYVDMTGEISEVGSGNKILLDSGRTELSSQDAAEIRSWRYKIALHRPETARLPELCWLEGYLLKKKKKSSKQLSVNKKRWCQCDGTELRYFDKPNGLLLGTLLVSEMKIELAAADSLTLFVGSSNVYDFTNCETSGDYTSPSVTQWATFLSSVAPGGAGSAAGSSSVSSADVFSSVPEFLDPAINHIMERGLDELGLFRVTGDALAVDMMAKRWKQGSDVSPIQPGDDVHVVCAAVKRFFRDLKEPLIPAYAQLVDVASTTSSPEEAMLILSEQMSPVHFACLTRIFALLGAIIKKSEVNKMTAQNLSVVWTPALLRPPATSNASMSQLREMEALVSLMALVIEKSASQSSLGSLLPPPSRAQQQPWSPRQGSASPRIVTMGRKSASRVAVNDELEVPDHAAPLPPQTKKSTRK